MPEQTVIAWDLETIPDLAAAARMLDMVGAPDEDVRAALGTGFPKHPLHKIACILEAVGLGTTAPSPALHASILARLLSPLTDK
jgi:hypothetical protein